MTAPELIDTFDGDSAYLIRCIGSLIALNDSGSLVPHGIGGHARGLLSAAAVRLTKAESALAELNAMRSDLLSIVERFIALPGGSWHVTRHATEEAELMRDARAYAVAAAMLDARGARS